MSNKTKVSLRGASAKEITREDLLQRATIERNIRNEARRAASAAQLIQRVWRGYHSVCEAEIAVRSAWDAYVSKEWSMHQTTASVQTLTDCIVRPFLFFTRRYHHKKDVRGDRDRFVICFRILLQSINTPDSLKNYCSLSTGSEDQQSTWRCQVLRLFRLSCLGMVEGTARHYSDSLVLASLSVRMLVVLTDSNMWLCFHDEDDKARAKVVAHELLEQIAEGNGNIPLYPAVGVCIEQLCQVKHEDGERSVQLQKEQLLIVASAITVALRPLQQIPLSQDINRVDQSVSAVKRKASENFCSCIMTVPYIVRRLPTAILPALQHPSVLSLCLQAFETLILQMTTADIYTRYFKTREQQVLLVPNYGNFSPSAAALINIVALSKDITINGSTKFVDALAFSAYLKAVCALLDQSLPWIKSLQTASAATEQDDNHECLVHKTGYSKRDKCLEAFSSADTRLQMIKDLSPLCQHWHLKQLLDQSCRVRALEAEHIDLSSATVTAELKLSDIAMLYSRLSSVFKSLHEERIPCPVLNLLAFAPGFLCQLWVWLDDVLGLSLCCKEEPKLKTVETKETGKHLDSVSSKDERPGSSLSSRWAFAVSKIKGKGSCSDAMDSNVKVIDEDRVFNMWDIDRMRSGPKGMPKEVLHVLTLFCAAYGHLLMILDDNEFYERQVPFTLKQQRVIAASLNTLVYNGLLSASKQNFLPLLEVTIKCLNSLYGRDCRRSFCSVNLWLAPAVASRPPIPAAARAHEVALTSIRLRDYSQAPAIGYVLALIPHDTSFLWWNRRVADGKRTPSWQKFRSAIRKAFEPANADFHARSSLRRLSQTGSLAAYITEFQRLTLEIETLSPSDKLHSFIDGLEPNLKDDVHKFDPATLDAAITYVERLGDNRRQGRNFFPGERSFNNNRSFQRDNRGRYTQDQQRSSQNYQPARQFSSGQFFGNQSSGQQSFRPRFSGQATPSQTGSSSNSFRNRGRPRQDRRRNDRRNFQRETTSGQHASTSSAPSTSQSSRSGLCTICGGNHRWYECPKRPNPSTTRRNTNMESCPETEQCSTSTPDKGKQAVRAVRVSKVVSVLMLNANTNVLVPVNLSNQVLSLLGCVGNHPLNVLVDSGCSTNFVSTMLVSKLRLPTQQSVEAFQVELADGSYLQCNKKVQQLEFQIQDYKDQLGFSVMPLSHYDMILGQSWLYQYDPIISFRDHSIRLFHRNQEVELRGLFNTANHHGICYASEAFGTQKRLYYCFGYAS
ncbi:hypothetical protein L7F22_042804 [Adiantum nelumboides]|nr:hypothetical protein [Adiantum nelumboides]